MPPKIVVQFPKEKPQKMGEKGMIDTLKQATKDILARDFSNIEFERLFRVAYDLTFCGRDSVLKLINSVIGILREHGQRELLPRIKDVKDPDMFLKAVCDTHEYYAVVGKMVCDIFLYPYSNRSSKNDPLPSIENEEKRIFSGVLTDRNVGPRLTEQLVTIAERARFGEVDIGIIRRISSILFREGLGDPLGDRALFERLFETPYLDRLRLYLQDFVRSVLNTCECPMCLERFETLMKSERSRASKFQTNDRLTEQRVYHLCLKTMIEDHPDEILDMRNGLFFLISNKVYGSATLLYILFKQAQEVFQGRSLNRLEVKTGDFVTVNCLKEMNPLYDLKSEELRREHGLKVIGTVIEVKNLVKQVIKVSFEGSRSITDCMIERLKAVMNSDRLPMGRFLALYADDLATDRGRSLQETEIDAAVEDIADLFVVLKEKDVFERYYKSGLRTRLLNSVRFDNVDTEKQLLDKLKHFCSKEFMNSAVGMIKEFEKAHSESKEFKQFVSNYRHSLTFEPFELGVVVLTKNTTWDFRCPTLPWKKLSGTIRDMFGVFSNRFYAPKFDPSNHRKLLVLPTYGSAVIKYNVKGRMCSLTTSTAQMLILDQFNRNTKISFEGLSKAVCLPDRDISNALTLLSKVGLMRRERTDNKQKSLSKTDVFFISPVFKPTKPEMVCFQAYHPERVIMTEQDKEDIEKGRALEIQAAIIRVMKARKTQSHERLFAEVYELVSHRFNPSVQLFKLQVSELIEKEYLTRGEERGTYRYVA